MGKNAGPRVWLWLVLFLILAGIIGYLFWFDAGPNEPRKDEGSVQGLPKETVPPAPSANAISGPQESTTDSGPAARVPWAVEAEGGDPCPKLKEALRDFFQGLEAADYVHRLNLPKRPLDYFARTIRGMEENPPVPAGEGLSPSLLVSNVFHLYRALDRETLRLGAEILRQEEDNLEIILRMFYDWQTLSPRCPAGPFPRLSDDAAYRYAGFFLNTVGGRAYLSRRSVSFRLLASYYALCLVHEADKAGRNALGIDVRPFILPLMEEMSRYSDFLFHETYMRTLDEMDRYYRARR